MSEGGVPQRGVVEELIIAQNATTGRYDVFLRNDLFAVALGVELYVGPTLTFTSVRWGLNRNTYRTKDFFAVTGANRIRVYSITRAADQVLPSGWDPTGNVVLEQDYNFNTLGGGPDSISSTFVTPRFTIGMSDSPVTCTSTAVWLRDEAPPPVTTDILWKAGNKTYQASNLVCIKCNAGIHTGEITAGRLLAPLVWVVPPLPGVCADPQSAALTDSGTLGTATLEPNTAAFVDGNAAQMTIQWNAPIFHCVDDRGHVIVSTQVTVTPTVHGYISTTPTSGRWLGKRPRAVTSRIIFDVTASTIIKKIQDIDPLPQQNDPSRTIGFSRQVINMRAGLMQQTVVRETLTPTTPTGDDTKTLRIEGIEQAFHATGNYTVKTGTIAQIGNLRVLFISPRYVIWADDTVNQVNMVQFPTQTLKVVGPVPGGFTGTSADGFGKGFWTGSRLKGIWPWFLFATQDSGLGLGLPNLNTFVEWGSPAPDTPVTLLEADLKVSVPFADFGGLTHASLPYTPSTRLDDDPQMVLTNNLPIDFTLEPFNFDWMLIGTPDDPVTSGVILCHPTTRPACFLAQFPGGGLDPQNLEEIPVPLDVTASGRIAENMFTSTANNYEDEAVLVFQAPTGTASQIMLPQELQSTGADKFKVRMKTGVVATAQQTDQAAIRRRIIGDISDTHRLQSIEPLLRRGLGVHPGSKRIYLNSLASDVLDKQVMHVGITQQLPDLTGVPVKAVIGPKTTGRYFGLQLVGSNPHSAFRYLGAILRGRRVT